VNRHIKALLSELDSADVVKPAVQLPASLHRLFAELEFFAEKSGERYPLRLRGDGLRVSHIPPVLKWMADQANANSAPGKPRARTIWGFEEPENSLELLRAEEMTRYFMEQSDEIQSMITTHSPAVYSVAIDDESDNDVHLFSVSFDQGVSRIRKRDAAEIDSIDTSVGITQLLSKSLQRFAVDRQSVVGQKAPSLVFEGESDQYLFAEAARLHRVNLIDSEIVGPKAGERGGYNWVCDQVLASHINAREFPVIGIVDRDEGARIAKDRLRDTLKRGKKKKIRLCIGLRAPCSEHQKLFDAGLRVPIAVEELLGDGVWTWLEQESLLEHRVGLPFPKGMKPDESLVEWLRRAGASRETQRRILMRPTANGKRQLVKRVRTLSAPDRRKALSGLVPTLEAALMHLSRIIS